MDRKKFLITLLIFYSTAGMAAWYLSSRPPASLLLFPDTARTALSAPPAPALQPAAATATVSAQLCAPVETPEPEYIFTASHKSHRLFIRSGPSLEAQIIGSLQPGETGDVIMPGTEWTYLRFDGLEGYVYNGYLTLTEKEQADG